MDYFEKKQWIRIAVCTVLVAIGVLAMTGVFSGSGPLVYDPSAVNGTAVSSAQASEQGFGGEVIARVALEDGKIKTLTIDTPNETEGLGKRASEEAFTEQFIGKSGPFAFGEDGIEALSGATVTSDAALKAINSAVGGEEAAEAPAAEPAAEPAPEAAEAPETEPAAEVEAAADAIEATEKGFGGDVTVHVTMDGNQIRTLTVDTPDETAGLGQRASEAAFTEQFIGKSGPFAFGQDGIEALSGATVTSEAVLKAINRAAGTEEPAAESAPEPVPEATEVPATEGPVTEAPVTEAPAAEEPKAEETKAEEPAKETASVTVPASAAYRADAENSFSRITVLATAKNGKLDSVKILSEGEGNNDLLTDEIRNAWAKAILESGSAEPDAITGATLKFSAASVTEAMTEILAKINGEAAGTAETPAAEEAAEEPEEEAARAVPASAAYRADAENSFSRITVFATAKNGKLDSVKILSEGEGNNDLLTDEIRNAWAEAILESGSAEPDAITGATLKFSAASVTEAMTEILEKIAGN